MRRSIPLVVLLVASVARAEDMTTTTTTGTLPGGAMLVFNRLFLHENNNPEQAQPIKIPDSLRTYFDFAQCVCSQPGVSQIQPWFQGSFAYEILLENETIPIHAPLEIWVGTSCTDPVLRSMNCHQIPGAGTQDIASIAATNGIRPEVPVFDLMNPEPNATGCQQRVLTSAEWGISNVDPNGVVTGTPQYFISTAIDTDTLPPPIPTNPHAESAENAIQLSWDAPNGNVSDIAYFQALCATDLGEPATASPSNGPRYITPRTLCGAPIDPTLSPVPSGGGTTTTPTDAMTDAVTDAVTDARTEDDPAPDASVVTTLPTGLAQLDPRFICAEIDDPTVRALRIPGLQNGVPYTVVLLAVDLAGNTAGVFFTSTVTPQPVTDFWEDLQDSGSQVRGGFCLIAETYGDDNPITRSLRAFRDDDLATTTFGRWLIGAYYATLGKLGASVHRHVVRRIAAAIVLLPIVALALVWHLVTLPGVLAIAALCALVRRSCRLRASAGTRAGRPAPAP